VVDVCVEDVGGLRVVLYRHAVRMDGGNPNMSVLCTADIGKT
jgi:hypothetical protein